MAGSGSPRAFGCSQFATTIVPGLALLPPANFGLVSALSPAVSGWTQHVRRVEVARRIRGAGAVGRVGIELLERTPAVRRDAGRCVAAILLVERAEHDRPARAGERGHEVADRRGVGVRRILENEQDVVGAGQASSAWESPSSCRCRRTCGSGYGALKSAAVSVANLLDRMPTRAAKAAGAASKCSDRVRRTASARTCHVRKESRLHEIADSGGDRYKRAISAENSVVRRVARSGEGAKPTTTNGAPEPRFVAH